jgi:hypothetical protein
MQGSNQKEGSATPAMGANLPAPPTEQVSEHYMPPRADCAAAARSWRDRAACQYTWHLDWIDPRPEDAAECRAICCRCEVRQACTDAAMAAGEPWGIWGGLDPDERATMAQAQGIPPPRVLPPHGTNPRYAKHGCRCDACRSAHRVHERTRLRRRRQRRSEPSAIPDHDEHGIVQGTDPRLV